MSQDLVLEANTKFKDFKRAYDSNDYTKCNDLLTQLKLLFIQFPTFLPGNTDSSTREKEVIVARQTLEYAVLLNSKQNNLEAFERNMAHLKSLYDDFGNVMPSERRWLLTGLNLYRLLAQNRTIEFHTQLELIEDHDNMYIRDVIQLERFLMEGSYHKLLQARSKVPSNEYIVFLEMLIDTVRAEIAACSCKAYAELSLKGATQLLMFDSEQQTAEWGAKQSGWQHQGQKFTFERQTEAQARALPFHDIIVSQLGYAHEMERIV
eukprot:NODE_3837_length_888_cov_61.806833_g3684_i0.p1 GENE.NODE_3837_length_888_cov_61.806833_g3684_i0~~NODE_3837_length_888_cov_61.806833_g3684_i0.p1  ORF type:complete len:275 (-),score=101.19 NODE_3837_length_888_cov_61.806833_g3684_i0:62-853(-)